MACHGYALMIKARNSLVILGKQSRNFYRFIHNGLVKGNLPSESQYVKVGQYAEISREFTPEEVQRYGMLIGDMNPIHLNTGNENIMVHGMLTSSLFSSIFGTLIPGSVYRSQTLLFHSPIYCNESVLGKITVTSVMDRKRLGVLVKCHTTIEKQFDESKKILCVSGNAEVLLPPH
jgi:acyl dehydratase